jgi:excisionase family DNA binding protein
MPETVKTAVVVIGIDIGKYSFHVVGLNQRGAIVLRQRWSRGQVETRFTEATKLSGSSRSFLYEAMAAKELPFIKAGRRRLIAFDDLRGWLATHRVRTA